LTSASAALGAFAAFGASVASAETVALVARRVLFTGLSCWISSMWLLLVSWRQMCRICEEFLENAVAGF
jgi:hypothetical protein